MPHDTVLIATIAAGLGAAFILGLLSARLGFPPIVGYLAAGVVVGPFTPGFVADSGLASQLAELGIILLMFGVGLHFSVGDLAAVRRVVVRGAVGQALTTGTIGAGLALAWGWGWAGAAVLGPAISVASTVVLLKGLEQRDRLDSPDGRLAVGWLVVEDLLMVVVLVLLPAIAPMLRGDAASGDTMRVVVLPIALAIAKVALFVAMMFVVGRRFVPWLLEHVARVGSRELFTLAVLVSALGVGTIASEVFGVSFALGAFFAGAVIAESDLSHRAAAEALPMQDAFAVLFFVSVGMLFDPRVFVAHPWRVLALVLIIVVWKSGLAFTLLRLLGQPPRTARVVGTALGQIGEFSFIVAALGVTLGLISREAQALIIAAALAATVLNVPMLSWAVRRPRTGDDADASTRASDAPEGEWRVVLVGYGRVGAAVAAALSRAGIRHVVVEEQERVVSGLRKRGEHAIHGDATRAEVLERAGVGAASLLVVTAPEPFRARRIVEVARSANPHITVAVRTHSSAEQVFFENYLDAPGATGRAVYAEREAALGLAHYALLALGKSDDVADGVIASLRGQPRAPTETFASPQRSSR